MSLPGRWGPHQSGLSSTMTVLPYLPRFVRHIYIYWHILQRHAKGFTDMTTVLPYLRGDSESSAAVTVMARDSEKSTELSLALAAPFGASLCCNRVIRVMRLMQHAFDA